MSPSPKPTSGPTPPRLQTVRANGEDVEAPVPCSIHDFLLARSLAPRSVVVEHNGEAVAPSEFPTRTLRHGDRLEIVRIVAGG